MKKTLFLIALFATVSVSSAQARGIEAGDGIGTFMLGIGKVKGNDRKLYNPGLLSSIEYLHYRSANLGYGVEVSLHQPENRTNIDGTNRRDVKGHFLSLLPTVRYNFTPSRKSTLYAAVGVGVAQHQFKENLTPIAGGSPSETKTDFWRGTYLLRFGWDCLMHESWSWGVDARFQYLDKLAMDTGLGLRLGWRY